MQHSDNVCITETKALRRCADMQQSKCVSAHGTQGRNEYICNKTC